MRGLPEQVRADSTEASPQPAARRRALIVDGDAGSLAFAAEVLNSFRPGFEVATARDLGEAREWLDTFHPDLVLLGLEHTLEQTGPRAGTLLDDPRMRDCKVVVISDEPDAGSALPAGPLARGQVLSRPLKLQTLLSAVRGLVDV